MKVFTGNTIRFRLRALSLGIAALPLLALWLWEGGILSGASQIIASDARAVVAAHRIVGWLYPITSGCIFIYGISQTEPDIRLACLGKRDFRSVWLKRWRPHIFLLLGIAMMVAGLVASITNEYLTRLMIPVLATSLCIYSLGFCITVYTNLSASAAAGTVLILSLILMLLPPFTGLPIWVSLSPGPLGWYRGTLINAQVVMHSLVVFCISLSMLYITLRFPRQPHRLTWIRYFRGDNAGN